MEQPGKEWLTAGWQVTSSVKVDKWGDGGREGRWTERVRGSRALGHCLGP